MEAYTGVKFLCVKTGDTFVYDERLAVLNTWAFILAELGLTPVHSKGAYGNQSYRTDGNSLIITRSGMIPERRLAVENYVLIEKFDRRSGKFSTKGVYAPSSESILHSLVYSERPAVGAIMHGHSKLLEQYAEELAIPVTASFLPYGTDELAESALNLLIYRGDFIILKDHGFVAVGADIAATGGLVLAHYEKLIGFLKKK
jgi:ribulose-5-phosphate 4-epimerase/fuculose-1-phosphate aldolase